MGRIIVIGAHGRTGSAVVEELLCAGHTVTGTVRHPDHVNLLEKAGAHGAVVDLMTTTTHQLAGAMGEADAVVYAAGSGWGDPRQVVEQLDRDAIIRAVDAAELVTVDRFVLVSAHRTDEDQGDETVRTLLRAKRSADAHVRSTSLGWTIIRPDALTEGAPTGLVRIDTRVPRGSITRADLAAVIRAVIETPDTARKQFEVIDGPTRIAEALTRL